LSRGPAHYMYTLIYFLADFRFSFFLWWPTISLAPEFYRADENIPQLRFLGF